MATVDPDLQAPEMASLQMAVPSVKTLNLGLPQGVTPVLAPQKVVDPVALAQAKLTKDEAHDTGLSSYIPTTPGTGFGHKLLRGVESVGRGVVGVGEGLATHFAPGIMAAIPGTQMHNDIGIGRDRGTLAFDTDHAAKMAGIEHEQAGTEHEKQATAEGRKPSYMKAYNPATDKDEYYAAPQQAGGQPTPTGLEVPSIERPVKPNDTPLSAADVIAHNQQVDALGLDASVVAGFHADPTVTQGEANRRYAQALQLANLKRQQDATNNKAPKTEIQAIGGRKVNLTYDNNGQIVKRQDLGAATDDGAGNHVDSPLQGAEYLATLPTGVQNKVRTIGEGKIEVSPAYFRSKEGQLLLEQITQTYPNFDASRGNAYFAARQKFTSGKMADAIEATNATLLHAAEIHKLAGAWSQIPGLSALSSLKGGDAAKLRDTRTLFVQELGHAYKGGVITEVELHQFEKMVNVYSPWELRTNMETVAQRLNEITQSRNQEWVNSRPPGVTTPIQFYTQQGADSLRSMGITPEEDTLGAGASQTGNTPQVTPGKGTPRNMNPQNPYKPAAVAQAPSGPAAGPAKANPYR
jgi:hypothetical protein